MITNKYGIHTFSLKLQCKYSEIQNIIEQNECICTGKGKLGLSPYYQMPQFKYIGVEIQLGQSVTHPCWLVLIVNPSSLLAGTYKPTALFQADEKSVQQIKHRLRNILDKIGVDRRLKEFKLSRCDLTCNLYYERKADVQDRIDIFKKSFPIPITTRLSLENTQIPMSNSREPISIRGQSRISLKAVLSRFMINRMSLRNGMISRLTSIFFDWNCGLVVRKSPS